MDFVARESIFVSLVVSSNSIGVSKRLESSSVFSGSILVKVTDISFGELTSETGFVILNFEASEFIIVVKNGLLNELRVKHTFKEDIEVGHESGMVTELVLGEDGYKSIVLFVVSGIFRGNRRETSSELNSSEESKTVKETKVTSLNNERNIEVSKRLYSVVTSIVTNVIQVILTPE